MGWLGVTFCSLILREFGSGLQILYSCKGASCGENMWGVSVWKLVREWCCRNDGVDKDAGYGGRE